MTLRPLLEAPLAVQLHVVTVILAFLVGSVTLFISRKGSAIPSLCRGRFPHVDGIDRDPCAFCIHRRTPHSPYSA